MAKFSTAYLKTLVPRSTPYYVTEDGSPGFKLRVMASGSLSFYYVSKVRGASQSCVLGRYPTMTIASARAAYRALKDELLSNKIEVNNMNRLSKGVDSVETAITRYEETVLPLLREKTQADYRGQLKFLRMFFSENNYLDAPINTVFTRVILRPYIKELSLRYPTTAKHRSVVLNRIMEPYLDMGTITEDPLARLRILGASKPRQRFLNKEELGSLFKAMKTSQAHPATLRTLRIQLLTGLRPGEVCKLQGKNIVDDAISLLGVETKSNRHLVLPLSRTAHGLLQDASEPLGKTQFLMSTDRRYRKRLSLSAVEKCLARLCICIGIPHTTPHDLRRTVATHLGAMKYSNDVIDAVLNHAPVGVTQRHYNHYEYMEEKVAAMRDVEELMTSLGL
jgi:integrase